MRGSYLVKIIVNNVCAISYINSISPVNQVLSNKNFKILSAAAEITQANTGVIICGKENDDEIKTKIFNLRGRTKFNNHGLRKDIALLKDIFELIIKKIPEEVKNFPISFAVAGIPLKAIKSERITRNFTKNNERVYYFPNLKLRESREDDLGLLDFSEFIKDTKHRVYRFRREARDGRQMKNFHGPKPNSPGCSHLSFISIEVMHSARSQAINTAVIENLPKESNLLHLTLDTGLKIYAGMKWDPETREFKEGINMNPGGYRYQLPNDPANKIENYRSLFEINFPEDCLLESFLRSFKNFHSRDSKMHNNRGKIIDKIYEETGKRLEIRDLDAFYNSYLRNESKDFSKLLEKAAKEGNVFAQALVELWAKSLAKSLNQLVKKKILSKVINKNEKFYLSIEGSHALSLLKVNVKDFNLFKIFTENLETKYFNTNCFYESKSVMNGLAEAAEHAAKFALDIRS